MKFVEAEAGIEPTYTALQAACESQGNRGDAHSSGNIVWRVLAGFRPSKPLYIPSRRAFLATLAALPIAARASMASGLVDRRTLFSFAYQMEGVDDLLFRPREAIDLNGMLRESGRVCLPAGDFVTWPVYVRSGDVIEGQGIRTRVWVTGRGIQPEDESRPTEYVQLRDFDLCCDNRGEADQHALWLSACREWTVERVRAVNFGGAGAYLYGKRTPTGGLDPTDTTRCAFRQFASWGCRYGMVFGGTPADPVVRGGTSNMNRAERCLSFWAELDAFALLQGAANVLDQCVAGNSGGDGMRIAWYGNDVRLAVLERNEGYGIRKVRREWSDRTTVTYHSGGNNGLGDTNY